jgi:CheY-like chemotaxis protein
MHERVPTLVASQDIYKASKDLILSQWLSYVTPQEILQQHNISKDKFQKEYASGVFDYFMGVISGEVEIGNCPVMQELLAYLKNREISAEELFEICSHFRRSMVDFSYDAGLNSKELFDEISFIFDKNFGGILKFYTDTMFQKLIDARQEALKAGQAKEFFLSNMSHEIRTPLNAILGFVNLLISEELSDRHRKYLNIILNSGENLLSIINDILDFSKLRSGEFSIEPKLFNVQEEINHTIENIFTAFAQAQYSEHKNSSGTGLGLSISYQLVEHMGGVIDVESIYGLGSKFLVEIPVKTLKEAKLTEKNIQSFRLCKHDVGIRFKGHILVAEDNKANQELIKILLTKYGLSFDLVQNGLEAVELYKKNSYDLVLMDEQMPIMDGNEAVSQILQYEKDENLRHTPISALTANVIKGAKERVLNGGFDSFLGKPIVLKELERIFSMYLKVNDSEVEELIESDVKTSIKGLDAQKLKKELMLNEDELMMLLTLFIKKMAKQVPDLKEAIMKKDYKQIALNAHSIKGSSANFRLESLQKDASEMEIMAKAKNANYNYNEVFSRIQKKVLDIEIL